jgi:hypothetical protein
MRDRELSQDHIGRPVIVRCIPTVPTRRAALARDAGAECPMTTRARFLFRGTTVSVMARKLRCERRRAGQNNEQNRNRFCQRFATHPYASFYHLPVHPFASHLVSPFVLLSSS